VDAGYFDNDGIDSAVRFLRDPDIVDWLAANSSGVILLSLRAYPWDGSAPEFAGGSCEALVDETGRIASGAGRLFREVADLLPRVPAPLRAIVEVRAQAAIVRSNTLVAHLKALLEMRGVPFDFVPIENTTRVNMSWYLKRSEFDCLRDAARGAKAIRELEKIWSVYHRRSG
jgi:hypothetical protein